MRNIIILVLLLSFSSAAGQPASYSIVQKDSLLVVGKNIAKGFHHDYLLFIPKGTALHKKTFLLVEPNNTGAITDSMEVHKAAAIKLATVSSVGNNIATELKIPLLVPVFPRPASQPLMYTHALDRDVQTKTDTAYKRLDLQLVNMIADARRLLAGMDIETDAKIFMSGFSASATFTNRFSFIHPEKIKALAIGGFNGKLMLPLEYLDTVPLYYPVGLKDFSTLFGKKFDKKRYGNIAQFIYMGQLDDNDAVLFDDAYSEDERRLIVTHLGKNVQDRYVRCQQLYTLSKITPVFKTYENTGHWTTGAMNLQVIKFFHKQMKQ